MSDLGRRTLQKVIWRLVPFLGGLYALHIIDQANVGFARLHMKDSRGLNDAIIDWGYGIFAPKINGRFGVGPMAGLMAWGMLMAILCRWYAERRAAAMPKT
jgi:hypothetical protein